MSPRSAGSRTRDAVRRLPQTPASSRHRITHGRRWVPDGLAQAERSVSLRVARPACGRREVRGQCRHSPDPQGAIGERVGTPGGAGEAGGMMAFPRVPTGAERGGNRRDAGAPTGARWERPPARRRRSRVRSSRSASSSRRMQAGGRTASPRHRHSGRDPILLPYPAILPPGCGHFDPEELQEVSPERPHRTPLDSVWRE